MSSPRTCSPIAEKKFVFMGKEYQMKASTMLAAYKLCYTVVFVV